MIRIWHFSPKLGHMTSGRLSDRRNSVSVGDERGDITLTRSEIGA
jgi:hypothetical protein